MPPLPLVTLGCVMMRVCNLDTCPMGIATQNPELRKRFAGKPEYVVNFMYFIAQELREIMARLGIATVDELVGRTDLLKKKEHLPFKRAEEVDLSQILDNPYSGIQVAGYTHKQVYDFHLEKYGGRAGDFKENEVRFGKRPEAEHPDGCFQCKPYPGNHLRL